MELWNDNICFSTIQYNTTVKQMVSAFTILLGFSTIQYNTTVKRFCKFLEAQ